MKITTENTDATFKLVVADNGIGIDAKNQKQVFNKFYRVPTGDVHNVKGFGLGLFYVKSIVDAMGGSITMDSAPGEGTTFTIELPLRNE